MHVKTMRPLYKLSLRKITEIPSQLQTTVPADMRSDQNANETD